MKMMTEMMTGIILKLSNSEKILLTILGVLVILFLPFYLFTINVIDDIIVKQDEIAVLEAKEQDIMSRRELLPAVKAEAKTTADKCLAMLPNTAPMVKSYEVHYLFTDLIKQVGLEHQSLTVSELLPIETIIAHPEGIKKFDNSKIGLSNEEKLALGPVATMAAQELNISFSVKGNYSQILQLCDNINAHSKYIKINNIDIPNINDPAGTDAQLILTIYLAALDRGGL